MNELEKCIRSIDNIGCITTFSKEDTILIENLFKNMKCFDIEGSGGPDAYSCFDDIVLIIEHFEFDSSPHFKKGSEARKEMAKIKQESDKFHNEKLQTSSKSIFKAQAISDKSMEDYVINVTKVFNDHYRKTNKYKKNLTNANIITKNKKIKTVFFYREFYFVMVCYRLWK